MCLIFMGKHQSPFILIIYLFACHRFVIDTFNGHPFLRSFGLGVVTTDWIAFTLYLGTPILTFIITLFAKLDNWWEISLLTWFASILLFWCFFSACEFWLEIWACLGMMEEEEDTSLVDGDPWGARVIYWMKKAGHGTVRTMQYRLSGTHINLKRVDILENVMEDNKFFNCINCLSKDMAAAQSPYSFFANRKWNPCFVQIDEPELLPTLEKKLGNTTYVTRDSWSLEKLFCRKGGIHSAIPITQGDASITEAQINSNIACNLLGNIIIVLLFASFLVWFGLPASVLLGLAIIIIIIFFTCVGFATYKLVDLRRDIVNDDNPTLYRYWEIYQRSVPKRGLTRTVICLQVLFLYLVPLTYLCVQKNISSATVRCCITYDLIIIDEI